MKTKFHLFPGCLMTSAISSAAATPGIDAHRDAENIRSHMSAALDADPADPPTVP